MTNPPTSTATAVTQEDDTHHNAGRLDFRDINQHPPAATSWFTPLPADPSWDAHKVYFNERPVPPKEHGDDFDILWQHETPQIEFEQTFNLDEKKQGDETLDPLGWPVAPPAFRSTEAPQQEEQAVVEPLSMYDFNYDSEDDRDNDDLNLLKHKSSDDDVASVFLTEEQTTEQALNVSGVETSYQPGSSSALVGYRVKEEQEGRPSKAVRIQQYETTGVDEESSVEPDDDEESDDDDDRIDYMPQQARSEDEDDDGMADLSMPTQDFASFDTDYHPATMMQTDASSAVTAPMAQLHVQDKAVPVVVTSLPSNPESRTKPKNKVTRIPLLRPPPPEKLAAWEHSRQAPSKK